MPWKPFAICAAILAMVATGFGPHVLSPAQASECAANEHIDSSTADMAKKKIEASGYLQTHDLKKGCDNYWHGQATKDGALVNVSLSPAGLIKIEGD